MTFARRIYTPPPSPPVRPATRRASYAGGTRLVVVAKEAPVRPGKRTPTKAEREWMERIVRYGCIACRIDGMEPRSTAVHHILSGGKRMGHLFTLPLCDPGHHQGGKSIGLISRHPWKAQFESRYGTEIELLRRIRNLLGAGHGQTN